jgi:uroporphyrinogen decarboxylase
MTPLPTWHDSVWMKAARREPTDFTPVWLMRQAGRYQPWYRAIRAKTGFLELCKSPRLCAEVAVRAVEELGVDAAILFSDLLLVLEPMGLELRFDDSGGPAIRNPIREPADVDRLAELEDVGRLGYVMETVRLTRARLDDRLPLLGFSGAPFTLASYAIEGGASRDYRRTKAFMLNHPAAWNTLLERLARSVGRYLVAQLAAGAQAVQLFDSWVGCLGPEDYRRSVLPHSQAVILAILPGAPVVHFGTGNPALLPLRTAAGGDVIGVDWRIGLDDAWQAIGHDRAVQGNLDPAALLGDAREMRRRVQTTLDQAGGRPGHIFNLGHGVLPETPVENAIGLVRAVHELSRR